MTSNNRTLKVEIKNRMNNMTQLYSIDLEFTLQYITFTNYYIYCKEHIQMITNDSTINLVSRNNRVNKITKLHSIHLEYLNCNISHLLNIIL